MTPLFTTVETPSRQLIFGSHDSAIPAIATEVEKIYLLMCNNPCNLSEANIDKVYW